MQIFCHRLIIACYGVLLLGDFNSHISTNCGLWWNLGTENRNGQLFLEFFDNVQLKMLNSMSNSLGRFMWENNAHTQRSIIDYMLASNSEQVQRCRYKGSKVDDFYHVMDMFSDHHVLAASTNVLGPCCLPRVYNIGTEGHMRQRCIMLSCLLRS